MFTIVRPLFRFRQCFVFVFDEERRRTIEKVKGIEIRPLRKEWRNRKMV